MKNIIMVVFLLAGCIMYGANDIDKDLIILNQKRSDMVKSVFKKLMQSYEEEDEDQFFSLVSEDRFLQDFMLFQQAIEKDFRTYEILDFQYWIDKITSDGIKRYLYVKWEKRYQYIEGTEEFVKNGYSRFLFDEINGKYKLTELAGNVLWGDSLSEWKKETPHIAGEVETKQKGGLPDLTVVDLAFHWYDHSILLITFKIKNIGNASIENGAISYEMLLNDVQAYSGEYIGTLNPGETSPTITIDSSNHGNNSSGNNYTEGQTYSSIVISVIVDPNNAIEESNEYNNENEVTLSIDSGSPTSGPLK